MSMNFRYPNITGRTEREQLDQMKSYLHQMVEQLNYAQQNQSGTGQAGADGKDGRNGKTPKKGVDYWTEEDVTQLVGRAVEGVLKEKAALLEAAYPVGAVYLSASSTSPGTLFGFGTWERIQDRFLLAAGSSYGAGSTGGEAEHTLTTDEMPEHFHPILDQAAGAGNGYAGGTGGFFSLAAGRAQNTEYWWSNTWYSGGSKPHNNMPPYLAVYVWKRTA